MKTKETCKKCGGICKPSKGILNTHNIQTNDLSKEFETKLLDCLKCESCGHSWIPQYPEETFGLSSKTSTREQAIAWWNNLPTWGNPSKEYYIGLYYSDDTVTDERIEEIYDKEVLEPKRQEEWQESQVNRRYSKPNQKQFIGNTSIARMVDETIHPKKYNQKQFKTFDESLFKSYINKFNNEDKLLMLSTLACEISTVNPILNNLLNQISSYKGTK